MSRRRKAYEILEDEFKATLARDFEETFSVAVKVTFNQWAQKSPTYDVFKASGGTITRSQSIWVDGYHAAFRSAVRKMRSKKS